MGLRPFLRLDCMYCYTIPRSSVSSRPEPLLPRRPQIPRTDPPKRHPRDNHRGTVPRGGCRGASRGVDTMRTSRGKGEGRRYTPHRDKEKEIGRRVLGCPPAVMGVSSQLPSPSVFRLARVPLRSFCGSPTFGGLFPRRV